MSHCLRLERVAMGVTGRRLSGATIAGESQIGTSLEGQFEIASEFLSFCSVAC